MLNNLPLVSVIIPCRNEEKFIAKCLDSLLLQDYPKENLEILVVDGASTDKTKEIVEQFIVHHSSFIIRLLDNPHKYTPFGLNIGIKSAKGDIIIRIDAHAGYEKDYISKCVKVLQESGAENVGGAIKTLPAKDTITARAIAYVLSSPLGAASAFRLGSQKAMEVDTVFGGCFKREVFKKVGLFDERMLRSQDIEFNKRLKKAGGKIVLSPEIRSVYYPQTTLLGFLEHNFEDGVWVLYPLKFKVRYFSFRHLIPLILTGALIIGLILSIFSFSGKLLFILVFAPYLLLVLFYSLKISLRQGFRFFFILPLVLFSRHFGYGLGSWFGLLKIFI